MGLEWNRLGFESPHCHFLSRSWWESYFTLRSLSLLICKLGTIHVRPPLIVALNEIMPAECVVQFLAHNEYYYTYYKY